MNAETMEGRDAVAGQVERPVRPGAAAHKLTDRQIEDMAFAVLRAHNDDRLWSALTYSSGPYDVTTPTLALCHLARVFFDAGVSAALGGATQPVYCWLVENGKQAGSGLAYRRMDQGMSTWTEDPHKAIRFARRADAEMFAEEDEDAWRIVEHGFEA